MLSRRSFLGTLAALAGASKFADKLLFSSKQKKPFNGNVGFRITKEMINDDSYKILLHRHTFNDVIIRSYTITMTAS